MTSDHRVAGSSPAGCRSATRADPQAIWRSENVPDLFWYTRLIPTLGVHGYTRRCLLGTSDKFARGGRLVGTIVPTALPSGDPVRKAFAALLMPRPIWTRTDAIPCVRTQSDYAHFFPISSRPALLRSSEVMTTLNSTFALKVRNHGSARLGIFDGSDISTIMTAPR